MLFPCLARYCVKSLWSAQKHCHTLDQHLVNNSPTMTHIQWKTRLRINSIFHIVDLKNTASYLFAVMWFEFQDPHEFCWFGLSGVIVSTPTGSTAYAVAAGASMIHPNVPATMITPICPHSLSFRPIIVPAGVELKVNTTALLSLWVHEDALVTLFSPRVRSSCAVTPEILPGCLSMAENVRRYHTGTG